MDESKKPLMIGIVVVCFALAGGIFFFTHRGPGGGVSDIPTDEMQWVICRNAACNASYEIPKREFAKHMEENFNPDRPAAIVCRECGKTSVFQAVKCEKCGKVFPYGVLAGDFADRCPDCKFSKIEDTRKRRAAAGD